MMPRRESPYPMSELPKRLGVVGAGTMGAGIAQLGCLAGTRHGAARPAAGGARERRRARARRPAQGRGARPLDGLRGGGRGRAADAGGLARGALRLRARDRGRAGADRAEARAVRSACPRSAARRRCSPPTPRRSSSARWPRPRPRPENVVGMHFFNPPPLMRLLEVIAAEQTGERALALASGGGRGDGQDRDRGPRRPRLPREPLRAAVRRRGAAAAPGARGERRADRPHRPPGRRLPHGTVRADGPRRDRRGLRGGAVVHGAELRRAALEAEHAPGADGGGGPARPQDRPRLVLVRGRAAPARRSRAARARRRRRPPGGHRRLGPAGRGPARAGARRRLRGARAGRRRAPT